MNTEQDESLNVFGEKLAPCNDEPATGYYRDGHCNTCEQDVGSHTVCVEITTKFLEYSRFKGNDLSTPMPEYDFPGLKEGNAWCLCAARWLDAYKEGMAPRVHLIRTHQRALEIISMEILKELAVDLN